MLALQPEKTAGVEEEEEGVLGVVQHTLQCRKSQLPNFMQDLHARSGKKVRIFLALFIILTIPMEKTSESLKKLEFGETM